MTHFRDGGTGRSTAGPGSSTLAALRDSGALTDAEFEAEKRRILGG